jgi:hypothetical protein
MEKKDSTRLLALPSDDIGKKKLTLLVGMYVLERGAFDEIEPIYNERKANLDYSVDSIKRLVPDFEQTPEKIAALLKVLEGHVTENQAPKKARSPRTAKPKSAGISKAKAAPKTKAKKPRPKTKEQIFAETVMALFAENEMSPRQVCDKLVLPWEDSRTKFSKLFKKEKDLGRRWVKTDTGQSHTYLYATRAYYEKHPHPDVEYEPKA